MKNAKIFVAVFAMIAVTLACGSTGVQVNAPEDLSQEDLVETAMAEIIARGDSEDDPNEASEPTAAPAPTATKQVGTARSNPAPIGSEVVVDEMAFLVLGFTRSATSIVLGANQFNDEPGDGQEYVLVDVQISCQKSSDDKCNISTFYFNLIGSSGIVRDREFVASLDGLLEDGEFFGGAVLSGGIPFIINTDETEILLLYEELFGDTFYLAVE